MREVEAQPVRRDERALLRDVFAEHLPQGGVQQVRRRMVQHGGLAPRGVDRAVQRRAWLERLALPAADVAVERAGQLDRVADRELAVGIAEQAGVADLTARL